MDRLAQLIVLLLLSISSAKADTTIGGAFLASTSPKFPCERALSFYKKQPKIFHASLWQTFGVDRSCAERIFKLPQRVIMEWYVSNEVCRRKGNCYPYEVAPNYSVSEYNKALEQKKKGLTQKLYLKAKEIKDWCDAHKKPDDKCLLTIGLESQYTEKAAKSLIKIAKLAGWAQGELVHNPVGNAPYQGFAGGWWIESHGLHIPSSPASRRIVTLDGNNPAFCDPRGKDSSGVSFPELRDWVKRARKSSTYAALWCGLHQGLNPGTSTQSAKHPRGRDIVFTKAHRRWMVKMSRVGLKKKALPTQEAKTLGTDKAFYINSSDMNPSTHLALIGDYYDGLDYKQIAQPHSAGRYSGEIEWEKDPPGYSGVCPIGCDYYSTTTFPRANRGGCYC